MHQKNRRRRFKKRVYEMLDLPAEADLVTPRITMTGNDMLLVENNQEAVSCRDTEVRLMTSLGILTIEGNALELKEFTEGRAFLTGRIRGLAFEAQDEV